jgi:hypothetical protein
VSRSAPAEEISIELERPSVFVEGDWNPRAGDAHYVAVSITQVVDDPDRLFIEMR